MRTLSPPWRRVLIGSWIMIGLLSVVTLVLYVDNKRTKDCITAYMVADQRNTTIRAGIADRERAKFLVTLQVIFDPKATPEARRVAGESYIEEVLRNDQLRKQSPVLPVPQNCK